jgi:hypothetical protein
MSLCPIVAEKGIESYRNDKADKIVSLIKERANFCFKFWEMSDFFFERQLTMKSLKKKRTPGLMQQLISVLENIEI